jgi:hypothetical protein
LCGCRRRNSFALTVASICRQSSRAELSVKSLFLAAKGQREHSWRAHFQPIGQENDHAILAELFRHGGVVYANDFDLVALAILPRALSDDLLHGTIIRAHNTLGGQCSVSDTTPLEIVRRYEATLATVNSIKGPIVEELARSTAHRTKLAKQVAFFL